MHRQFGTWCQSVAVQGWRKFCRRSHQGTDPADNADAIREAAIAGLGIAGLPALMLGDCIERDALVPLLTDFSVEERSSYVLRPPGPASENTRAFIDAVLKRFGPKLSWSHC